MTTCFLCLFLLNIKISRELSAETVVGELMASRYIGGDCVSAVSHTDMCFCFLT
jgi:hypothetical protein